MTGYASGSVQANSVLLDFEIKSVNSKNLDLKIFLPEYLSVFENELRQIVLKKISRGSVFLKIKLNQQTEYQNNYVLNDKVLQNVFEKIENIERICDEKNIPLEPLKALDFLAVKGVWEENKNSSTNVDDIKKIVLDKIEELVVSLLQTRKKEGQGLHSILSEKLSTNSSILSNTIFFISSTLVEEFLFSSQTPLTAKKSKAFKGSKGIFFSSQMRSIFSIFSKTFCNTLSFKT
jgi:uncharacterized protein (TIGR00255 family)